MLQRHRNCYSNEMRPLPIFYLPTHFSALGTVIPKSFTGAFSFNSGLDMFVKFKQIYESVIEVFWDDLWPPRLRWRGNVEAIVSKFFCRGRGLLFAIDLFCLYVLFSHFRPCDDCFFQKSRSPQVDACTTNETTKGKFLRETSRGLNWENITYKL